MIAKNITLIINLITISSLQSSLQKTKLSHCLKQTFCLQTSLQVLADLALNCKESKTDIQHFNEIYFVSLVATITKPQQLTI